MKRCLSLASLMAVTILGCARTGQDVIEDAADALGGAEAIAAATTLVLEGTGTTYRLGQNPYPDADLPTYELHSYRKEVDLDNHRWRTEQVRTGHFLTGNPVDRQSLVEATDGDVAFDIQANGAARRLAAQAGKDRLANLYHHPLVLLKAALQGPPAATVGPLREEAGYEVVDVTPMGGPLITLRMDAATGLPTRVESTGYNPILGDVVIATSFAEWERSGELLLPGTIFQTLDRFPSGNFSVSSQVNAEIQDLSAPAEVTSAPEPVPPPIEVTAQELAPGVWNLAAGYNSLLVEFPSYTAIVEAARNDQTALAAIQKARKLVPDKPLQYVINTHFHSDHSGGIRAAVAEGLTVITHESHRTYFEEMVARPHTVIADHLANNPRPLQIETVSGDGPFELTDGNRTIVIHRLKDDLHADGMLVVYLPRERILVEADAFTPGARSSPFATNLLDQILDLGLRVNRIAPVHGRVVPFADLLQVVRTMAEAPAG
jgi:glyoxylase-like metal-dependent hydrolase (beta-lactamase superfamily II)